jgi:hypothetical protein
MGTDIGVDETFKPVFNELKTQFETLYKNAHLEIFYAPETDVINLLLQDSVQVIFIARDLNAKEKEVMAKKKIVQKTTAVGYDGVALLVNKNNGLNELTNKSLQKVFSGEAHSFDQLQAGLPKQDFRLVFENSRSGIVNFLANRYGDKFTTATNLYDAKTPGDLINYIAGNEDAIGFISSVYIFDENDTNHTTFIKNVKVLDLQPADSLKSDEKAVGPWQYFVAPQSDQTVSKEIKPPLYPLVRTLTAISYEGRRGLGHGFTAYIAGELGQRTILRFGLVPATMPVRILHITNEDIQIKK